jgi:dTDP-4-amino-4,6-dideoxygalactose transaminase
MRISFLTLKRQHQELESEVLPALERALASGVYILGDEVAAFEEEWASYCGNGFAATVASGTDALTLALIATGSVRPGHDDEVITTPLTAGYTALAILNAGARPVFADIDAKTCTLDPQAVEAAVTQSTRAIVPVHLYGQVADMTAINEIAAQHDLFVIEDAAQAHGACGAASNVVGRGRIAAYSFYPTKNLGAYGDGGAVVADDPDVIARVKLLRQGGHLAGMQTRIAGRSSRLDEIQAAILRVKLRHLNKWNLRRREIASQYDDALRNVPGLTIPFARTSEHVYHLYVIQHLMRDQLRSHLESVEIETQIHYPFLLHQQPLFSHEGIPTLPVAEEVGSRILSLPLYPQLTDDEVRRVIDGVLSLEFNL